MNSKASNVVLIALLLGIFMGAIDSGIVSPAREIIQNGLGVTRSVGMWMITIYTLTYAVSMPIVSKMADRYGRKRIYIYGITMFAIGSFLCGLSNYYGGFNLLLVARVIQAIGAGGVVPIATAVIGQSFPEEKRGWALGLVGAIYGVGTIIGPTIGSTVLDCAGLDNWGWIFFINIPLSVIILALSTQITDTTEEITKPLDLLGAIVVAGTVGSLMYALTKLNLFHFMESIKDPNVYPYLIIFVLLIPVLIWVEKRAEDPILNLSYFKNSQMLTTLILAFIAGVGMMGVIFVPQFAENVLKIKAGSGGYLVTLLAIFSGIASPFSGRLVDKKSARFVLFMGFGFTMVGTLVMGFLAAKSLTFISILLGLALMGFGIGFTMGAPLNYLALAAVPEREGATALATISLTRAMGVAISPNLMIGFIVQAAGKLQGELMQTVQGGFAQMMPGGGSMMMKVGSNPEAAKAFATLQSATVVDVVDKLKSIFAQIVPAPINERVVQGIEGMRQSIEGVFQSTLNQGYMHMFIASAIIALSGIIVAYFLKKKEGILQSKENLAEMEC